MKVTVLIALIALMFSLVTSCEKLETVSRGDLDELMIYCESYAHLSGCETAPDARPLDYYVDSAHTFSEYYLKYYLEQKSQYEDFDDSVLATIDTVTTISGHAVVDVFLEVSPGGYYNELGKMVLIETDPGLYQLLYAALTSPGAYVPERSLVEDFGYYKIIYTKSRYRGQFTWYTEYYWVYNIESRCFTGLGYYSAIRDTVESLIPDSCSLKRSTFVVDSLFWYNYLGQEGDHMNWPACGCIKAWFGLQGCELVPERIVYNPDEDSPH